jgi:hypothetical protein
MRSRGLGIVNRTRLVLSPIVASLAALLGATVFAAPVAACGGFFCTTVPVDQAAERVIFTMDEGTVTTYVQINYVGAAEDFAWILPVPAVPQIDTAEMATFLDLSRLTSPVYLGPRPPDCLRRVMPIASAPRSASESTTVHASGEVGPFGYHVVSSPNHQDLVQWLRENGYRVTPEMEPLVKMYTDDGLIFLAMKLRQGQNSRDIVPVKLTYESSLPMIPLRLTAVAATPDMPVVVWVFARDKVAPLNFAPIRIADSEVAFNPMGGHDYRRVVSRAVDQAGGRAFVTEFAGATTALRPPTDETAKLLFQQYPYLTRLYTEISPEEMTLDPVFDLSPGQPDVSNVHDLSSYPPPWNCSDDFNTFKTVASSGPPPAGMAGQRYLQGFTQGGAPKGLILFGLVALSAGVLARRRLSRISRWQLTPRATAFLFLETALLQGFHELEHVVQVTQRTVLGISKGAGMLGSVFDIEPVHMVYNLAFLALLAGVYAGCRRDRSIIPKNADAVMKLLTVSFFFQGFHTVEHVVKMWQYFATGVNGTPGIFGYWIPVVYLHLSYNTALYVPVAIAFFLGGFHLVAGGLIAEMVQGRGRRRTGPRMAS